MATASRKPTSIPVVGKLKAPSKSVGSINAVGKNKTAKSLKPLPGSRLASSPMAASEKHLPTSPLPGGRRKDDDDSGNGITSESLGSLVCIGGTQVGTLRYFGETHFETGLWCGVECAAPVGKNDGSVQGVRYFSCKTNYGIFAPLSRVNLVESNSGTKPQSPTSSEQLELNNRPKTLGDLRSASPGTISDNTNGGVVAPATTPVTQCDDNLLASLGIKRLKKDIKRGKDSNHHARMNQQVKKKRKLDSSQSKIWSGTSSSTQEANDEDDDDKCSPPPASTVKSHNADLPNLLTVKLKEEILGGSFGASPLFSPPSTYHEAFKNQHRPGSSSTPAPPILTQLSKVPKSRLSRLRNDKFDTPRSSRAFESTSSPSPTDSEKKADEKIWREESEATSPREKKLPDPLELPPPEQDSLEVAANNGSGEGATDETLNGGEDSLSPTSSTKEESMSDVINLEAFPAKRPSSISLFPGFSSEESSEQGIFAVSTPELIGGDSASLALSIPTSCCSSPEVLDNESSLGLLTPSHLQECWNSNTNDEDLYQHLRSPSVDDLEEFEEEDKTVDQDLAEPSAITDNYRVMSNSLNGALVVNENDGLISVRHPMHHSLHEELQIHNHLHPSQGRVRRDQTYTQLPTLPNLNQHHYHHHHSHIQNPKVYHHHHVPLSFRGSGSGGSGSGYCASDPFTDSDFNTESEADHDHDDLTSASNGGRSSSSHMIGCGGAINSTSMKNRSARVIDGALYTSHHQSTDRTSPTLPQQHQHHPQHQTSQSQHQPHHHMHQRQDSVDATAMVSSSISVSVSSTSASACASEMESSGFYSDASERNPSGGSVMSESDGYRSSRHLSKSSSDCDDSVALSMGMKMAPLKPLTQSEDDSILILEASDIYDDDGEDMSSFEASSLANDNSFNTTGTTNTKTSVSSGATIQTLTESHLEAPEHGCKSPGKCLQTQTPSAVDQDRERGRNNDQFQSGGIQRVPQANNSGMSFSFEKSEDDLDLCEDMDVDLFAEFDEHEQMETLNNNGKSNELVSPAEKPMSMTHGERGKEHGVGSSKRTLGASHEDMDLELPSKIPESLSIGASPLSSPMMNGNLFVDGELIADLLPGAMGGGGGGVGLSGGGGGVSCVRSQSVNCIASLTSSTSSASTVTAKSCVSSGAGATSMSTTTTAANRGGRKPTAASHTSFRSKIPSIEHIPLMCDPAIGKDVKGKVVGSGLAGKSGKGLNGDRKGAGSVTTLNKLSTSIPSLVESLSSTAATEQSSIVSTSTVSNNRRATSRVSTTSGKSSAGATSGGRKAGAGVAVKQNANTSTISSISTASVSSSTDLNRTSRSQKPVSNVHGSTRSLASVGLAPSSNKLSACQQSAAAKKLNKWDAVMSKIAETKHKTINVKDVKSKVFNSGKSAASGIVPPSSTATKLNNGHGQTTSSNPGGKSGAKSGSRVTLAERENDPLVPPAVHRRQHHFSSRSSTISDSSLDDHPQRGPPSKHRAKKDATINRRQVSDLSSASEYSATHSLSQAPPNNSSSGTLSKTMTTGGTRRPQRNAATTANSNATGASNGTKTGTSSASSKASNSSTAKSTGTKGAHTALETKKKGLNTTQNVSTRGVTTKSKVGSSTVSSQNDPSTKSHPALKPLRDRNRLGPVGKNNYGSAGLDANANESDAPLLRHGQQANGELEHSTGKTARSKVPGSAEPLIDNNTSSGNHLIISKSKSSTNNRVSSANQQNIQNSVLVQENSSLKEEVGRLTSVVTDLQEQISRLTASSEESKRTLGGCLEKADTSIAALTIVVQRFDQERQGVYEQLVYQQAENKVWKQRLDEKLAELQKLQGEYEKEREVHQVELRTLQENHEIEVDVTVRNCENKLEQLQKRHDETLAELKRSHNEELERLQETQKQELEHAKQKHKELLDQHRNQSPHDILHKEVESLQVVVEMRNEEIRVLRKDLMDYKNTLNDLQMAREHGKSLMAKIEDLEAQLEKARSDKRGLQERYQNLEAALHQVESDNSRLVRCNEELTWKMKSYNLVEN